MSLFSASQSFSRPNWAEISLPNLRHNARMLAEVAGGASLLAVVKAGAYGHGAYYIARALENEPEVAVLGVASADEGAQLRGVGIEKPILVLSGLLEHEAELLVHHDLTATVCSLEFARALDLAAQRLGKTACAHFKVDTGMARLGADCQDAPQILRRILELKQLEIKGIYTHMACADEQDDEFSPLQMRRFSEFLKSTDWRGKWIHAANSATLLRYPNARFNLVRPGIALYGAHPCGHLCDALDLRPVMTWKTRITFLRSLQSGQSVSYGAIWRAERPSLIAVAACGYADGYGRALSNRGEVLVRGQRCRVVGRVTMDQILIDVTQAGAQVGDEVVLWGQGLPVEEVAEKAGTISYELLCAVSARVPRVVLA